MEMAYVFGLLSNLCFAVATIGFTKYSHQLSPLWMNTIKCLVACFCGALALSILNISHIPNQSLVLLLALSGIIGLGLGDILLLKGFVELGGSRTLVLFGFHPLILGYLSFLFLGQKLDAEKSVAIFFLLACLFTFSYEGLKQSGSWKIKGISLALAAVALDACGTIITRISFDSDSTLHPLTVQFIRTGFALVFLLAYGQYKKMELRKGVRSLSRRDLVFVVLSSVLGTFLSLFFGIKAVQTGHLATLSALGGVGPLFTALLECVIEKKWPTKYFLLATLFFFIGLYILLW
jgi:drug/metabolite transporter (DMT)-like permease